jgi:mono/diheme cytochrome c family protein
VFKTSCSYCHKEDLSGGFFDDGLGRAPALAGKRAFDSSFIDRWSGQTLADMVATIAATMPQKQPASLTLENYIDVASYLLSQNEIPDGPADLPPDVESLRRIAIAPKPASNAVPRTVNSPPYTDEQSTRGEAMYAKACGPCHNDKSLAPLLQGDAFLKNWSDRTVGALIEKIQATMPLQDPGSLGEQQAIDLAAYVLKVNHLPAGQTALSNDPAASAAVLAFPR